MSAGTSVATQPVLAAEGIGKRFGGLRALDDVSIEVPHNEVLGIIGPNGAGKTTLFNLIAGTFPPSSGRIVFRSRDITRKPPYKRARLGIGRTFQLTQPFRSLSVVDNLRAAALASGGRSGETELRILRIVEYLGLGRLSNKLGADLNAVEAKRVELGRALATGPSVLLLDEIFSGSSADEVDELIALVRQLQKDGITILVIEHNVHAIRSVADRVIAIDAGRVISKGTPEEVFSDPLVVESYLGQHSQA